MTQTDTAAKSQTRNPPVRFHDQHAACQGALKVARPCNYRNLNSPSLYSCACCGVCVARAVGPKTRRPPLSSHHRGAARIKGFAILDAEVVCLDDKGVAQFDTLHSRTTDRVTVACAFDLLMQDGDDLRKRQLIERKSALGKLLIRSRGGISTSNMPMAVVTNYSKLFANAGWRASFQRSSMRPIGQDHRKAGSRSRTRRRQRRRAEGTF
jgi:hypothetical protein